MTFWVFSWLKFNKITFKDTKTVVFNTITHRLDVNSTVTYKKVKPQTETGDVNLFHVDLFSLFISGEYLNF